MGMFVCFILKWIHFCVLLQNADTVKLLSNTKQSQDDLLRARQQLESELESLRQEKRNMVGHTAVNNQICCQIVLNIDWLSLPT